MASCRRTGERARAADHVDRELLAWLAAQPLHFDVRLAGRRLAVTHASPCPPHIQYVLPHSPELNRIGHVDADVVVIGHTHRQLVDRVGRPLVINPGSVGQALDHANGKRLSYAVLELTRSDRERRDRRLRDQETVMTIKDKCAIVGVGATEYYKRGQSYPRDASCRWRARRSSLRSTTPG